MTMFETDCVCLQRGVRTFMSSSLEVNVDTLWFVPLSECVIET